MEGSLTRFIEFFFEEVVPFIGVVFFVYFIAVGVDRCFS